MSGLEEQAQHFAEELTETVRKTVGVCDPFRAQSLSDGSRFVVEQKERHGVSLRVNGTPLLSLKIKFDCCLDDQNKYLAIEQSTIKVYAGAKAAGEPLFRYEYERFPVGKIPAAHIHFHAHRDAFTAAMVRAGKATRRGSKRANTTEVPKMSELHFPVGGHRFRPSLEDILEMLIEEFGISHEDDFRVALRAGRKHWRRKQVRAVVRDDPYSAIEALESMGYDIQLKNGVTTPLTRTDRLEEL